MITEARIRTAMKFDGGRNSASLRDPAPRGHGRLVLVARKREPETTAEWYAFFFHRGRRCSTKLGSYPSMSVKEARQRFQEACAPAIVQGLRPEGPRVRARQRAAQGTVEELFTAYVDHLRRAGRVSADVAERLLLGKSGAVHTLHATTLACDVTPADLSRHLAPIHARGSIVMARDVRSYIGAAFTFGMRAANDYTTTGGRDWGIKGNPVAGVPVDPASFRVGERHLSAAEYAAFWRWLETQDARSSVAPALRLIMATGQRVKEVLALTESAYDRDEGLLDWAKTKNGFPHTIPLPSQAAALLDGLVAAPSGLFFAGRDPREPATPNAVEKLVARYASETGSKAFAPRDLRRTWKTLAGAAGLSKEIRDRMQNHARTDVSSRHYDRWSYMPEKREAMERWSVYLNTVLAG